MKVARWCAGWLTRMDRLIARSGGALLVAVASLCLTPAAFARIPGLPVSILPEYENTLGFGASYGPFLERNADFWGLAVDYSRRIRGPWSAGASLAFDRETDRSAGMTRSTSTLSAVAVVGYSFRALTLTTGLSKGFADTDRQGGDWEFVSGDWGTGLVVGTSFSGLTSSRRLSIVLSAGYEYNLSAGEPDLSFDAGVAYAF